MTPAPRDYFLLVALALCWGTNYFVTKVAVAEIAPATLTLGRLGAASAVLLLVHKAKRLDWPHEGRVWAQMAVLALTANAIPYLLIAWAQLHVDSGLAAILIAAAPLFTLASAQMLTSDEKLTAWRAGGVALGFVGIVVLVGVDALAGLGRNLWAQLALLGAAFCYGLNAVLARRLPPTPTVTTSLCVSFIAGAMMFPVAVAVDGLEAAAPSWPAILAVLWLGAVSTALALLIYFTIIAAAGATFAILANYLVPLLALGLGGLFLGESPTWNALLALALILAGVYLTGRGRAAAAGSN
ncbi:MAG: DMT family transporter [Alphaproteobacteria bacterium]|jgi:drug/metabolite transporter (DMT)-like permease|nr:DMT family transporter [Alphaproteobacteria bacterium]